MTPPDARPRMHDGLWATAMGSTLFVAKPQPTVGAGVPVSGERNSPRR